MNLTSILRNFRDLLKVSYPFLHRAGLTGGEDEWDDFLEAAFHATVSVPIEERTKEVINWRYGTWGRSGVEEPPVSAIIVPGTEILAGEPKRLAGGAFEVQYRKIQLQASPTQLVFRQLGHPFMDESNVESLDYVLGEVVGEDKVLPDGAHVCAPFETCEFRVSVVR